MDNDIELKAMHDLVGIVEKLEPEVRKRVLQWVAKRVEVEEILAPATSRRVMQQSKRGHLETGHSDIEDA